MKPILLIRGSDAADDRSVMIDLSHGKPDPLKRIESKAVTSDLLYLL